jgi:ubiquitin-protein ligase
MGVSCGDLGASIGLENENDIFVWNVIFEGPSDTLYEVSNRKNSVRNFKSKSLTIL